VEILIKEYLTEIQTSKKRNKKYLLWKNRAGVRIAKKYRPIRKGKDGFVYDCNGDKYYTNRIAAGTPKTVTLSGNSFMRGYGDGRVRARCMEELKKDMIKQIKAQEVLPINPADFPIRVKWELYCPLMKANKADWDLDNMWFYMKAFLDALQDCEIIPDDNINFITSIWGPQWFEVSKDELRRMIFVIEKDSVERIKRWSNAQ
jgi:Holliday junction resolvase RusA-like endonuclease